MPGAAAMLPLPRDYGHNPRKLSTAKLTECALSEVNRLGGTCDSAHTGGHRRDIF